MTRMRRALLTGALALAICGPVLAACSTSSAPSSSGVAGASAAAQLTAPLAATVSGSEQAWAVVAMGDLGDPLDTFWQVFSRPAGGGGSWSLVTPPGVADNGGVVVASIGAGATVGFEPSQDLRFSPVATSADGGSTWSPSLLPSGLVDTPGALAASGAGTAALLRSGSRGGTSVVFAAPGESTWRTLATTDRLGAAGRACGVGAVTAVSFDGSGHLLVGTTCGRGGTVGIFAGGAPSSPTWRLAGPVLAGAWRGADTSVLRLVEDPSGLTGLVAAERGSERSVFVVHQSVVGGSWSVSVPFLLAPSDAVASSGFGADSVVVLVDTGTGRTLESVADVGGGWDLLPPPPAGTAAVAVLGGEIDALAVHTTRMVAWRLEPGATAWQDVQSVDVPIQFGSSQ